MKNQHPLVSVVMPAYNAEQYICQAIQSILEQTYTNWELIIANDRPHDKTKQIVQAFTDPRIKYYQNSQRLGYAGNLNKTIRLAKGELIALLDDDDIADKTRLEKQVAVMMSHPNLVILGSWARIINAQGQQTGSWRFPTQSKVLKARLYIQFPFVHPSTMIRAAALKQEKKTYDKNFLPAVDYDLFFRLSRRGEVAIIPQFLVKYRIHSQNMSQIGKSEYLNSLPKLLSRELSLLGLSFHPKEVTNLVNFLHPRLAQHCQIWPAVTNLFVLNRRIRKVFALNQIDLLSWDWYLLKTLILQLLMKISPR